MLAAVTILNVLLDDQLQVWSGLLSTANNILSFLFFLFFLSVLRNRFMRHRHSLWKSAAESGFHPFPRPVILRSHAVASIAASVTHDENQTTVGRV